MPAYNDNGDMIAEDGQVFRQVGWQIQGGANDGLIIGRMNEEKLKERLEIPHGGFTAVYIEVGKD